MKKCISFTCILVSSFIMAQDFEPDELLIQFKAGSDEKMVTQQLTRTQETDILSIKKISNPVNIYQVKFESSADLDELIHASFLFPDILNIQKNHKIEDRFTPDDTQYTDQWHLHNTGQTGGTIDADIDAPEAWDITTGGLTGHNDTIVVCIIESNGVDISHEDLADNIWKNYDEIPGNGLDDDSNGYVDDYLGWNVQTNSDMISAGGHGTKVAGMIGAVGNNDIGISGINHDVKMMIVQGQQASNEATVIAAYSYPLEMRKKYNASNGAEGAFVVVTNSSWGWDNHTPEDSPLWCVMYDSLGKHGIMNIAATTNNDVSIDVVGDLPTTCTSEYLIAVTMSNSNDMRAGSGYSSTHVDLAAPGSNVLVTNGNDTYNTFSGTSFATPAVTGVVALLYSAPCANFISFSKNYPDSGALKIREFVLNNVDVIPALAGDVVTGGRLNANQSLIDLVGQCDQNSCITPYGLHSENLTDTSATFSWSGVNNGEFVIYLSDNNGNIQTANTSSSTNYSFDNLTPCSTYNVWVAGICSTDTSNQTAILTFQTDGCCINPNIIQSNVAATNMELSWTPILYANEYIIRYRLENETIWTYDTVTSAPITISNLDTCLIYEVEIKTICTDSTSGFGETRLFSTTGCGICYEGFYCLPESANVNSTSEWIESIVINGYSSATGNNGGYYSGDVFTNGLKPNLSYPFTFTPGYNGFNFTEHFSLWVDLDLNGTFEPSELLINNLTGTGVQSGLIYMPSFSTSGITKMRIAMNGTTAPSICADEAGDIFGEYEDYCIQIGGTANIDDTDNVMKIYPNPAQNLIQIQTLVQVDKISIYNSDGKLVLQISNPGQNIDISQLSRGVYFINIFADSKTYNQKLVKN